MTQHLKKHAIFKPSSQQEISQPSITEFVTISGSPRLPLEDNLLNWVIDDFQAFTILDQPKFRKIFVDAGLTYPASSPRTVRRRIEERFIQSRAMLREQLKTNCNSLAISLDCWTSSNGHPILGIVGHWVTPQWNINERVLEFVELQGVSECDCFKVCQQNFRVHTGQNLAAAVLKALRDLEVEKKLLVITADNASNNAAMMRDIGFTLSARHGDDCKFLGEGWEVRCLAHVLNLIAQSFLGSLHVPLQHGEEDHQGFPSWGSAKDLDVVERIRLLCLWIRSSPQRHHEWLRFAPASSTRKTIRYDVKTRWNSTCRMLTDAVELRSTVDKYTNRQQELESLALRDQDWRLVEDILSVLTRFEELTLLVSKTEPQICVVTAIYYELQDLLQEVSDREESFQHISEVVSAAAKDASEKHQKYYKLAQAHDLYYVAAILDPRIKSLFLQGELGDDYADALDKIRKFVSARYPVSNAPQPPATDPNAELSFAQKIARKYTSTIRNSLGSDLDSYLESEPVPDSKVASQTDSQFICEWWKTNGGNYPIMSQVAREIL